jgi:hypothetical protein
MKTSLCLVKVRQSESAGSDGDPRSVLSNSRSAPAWSRRWCGTRSTTSPTSPAALSAKRDTRYHEAKASQVTLCVSITLLLFLPQEHRLLRNHHRMPDLKSVTNCLHWQLALDVGCGVLEVRGRLVGFKHSYAPTPPTSKKVRETASEK